MGIKKIHNILKKYSKNSYKEVHLSKYSLKRVAIDVSLYLFKSKARAKSRYQDNQWPCEFMYLICCLRKNNIHPVFIYDTKAPVEKKEEREKRAEKRQNQRDRITVIQASLDKYIQNGEIDDILREINDKLRSEDLTHKSNRLLKTDDGKKNINVIDVKAIEDKIKKLKSQIIEVSDKDFKTTEEIFKLFDVPYFFAPGEAEAYCCYLNLHGYVDAVLSEDTDVLAYGCTSFLTKLDTVKETVIEINREELVKDLGLTPESFLDFCILCGTDYNVNVKGLGPEKSFKLIQDYKSIEKISEITDKKTGTKKYDVSVLNHQKTRELFKIPEKQPIKISYCGTPDFIKINNYLKIHNLYITIDMIKKSYTPPVIEFI